MHASSFVKLFVAVLAAVSPAAAELSVTAPIAGTTCTGGQVCQVAWEDNHTGVTLAQQGNCTVALYTGNSQQQTFLQPIAFPTAINVATTAAIQFTVDPTIGPNGSMYFIRFSSTSLQNPNSTGNPYLSFSAKFTLAGMSGTFNSTVQGQLAALSSTAGATATGATTTHATTSSSHTTTTSSTASHTSTTGGALPNAAGSALVAAGALFAGVVALF